MSSVVPRRPGFARKAKSFGKALLSRYMGYNARASVEVTAVRDLSCNGDGGTLLPCPNRVESTKFPGSYVCGACGCGDRRAVLIYGDDVPAYNKLMYPYLSCPINMPGFSNYVPSPETEVQNERREWIEAITDVPHLKRMAIEQQRSFRIDQFVLKARRSLEVLRGRAHTAH